MKGFITERNIVIILFVAALVTFSLAQEDSKKIEKMYAGTRAKGSHNTLVQQARPATTPVDMQP